LEVSKNNFLLGDFFSFKAIWAFPSIVPTFQSLNNRTQTHLTDLALKHIRLKMAEQTHVDSRQGFTNGQKPQMTVK
jgi:hypothetical protein